MSEKNNNLINDENSKVERRVENRRVNRERIPNNITKKPLIVIAILALLGGGGYGISLLGSGGTGTPNTTVNENIKTKELSVVINEKKIEYNGKPISIEELKKEIEPLDEKYNVTLRDSKAIKSTFEEALTILKAKGFNVKIVTE